MSGDLVPMLREGASRPLPKLDLQSVTIVGMGPTAPYLTGDLIRGAIPHNAENPIWAINAAAKAVPFDLAWNTHDLNELRKVQPMNDIFGWYEMMGRPVVTLRPVPNIPTLIYPIKEVVEYWQDTYFFAAPSYMLAYAAWCGCKEFRLYGLDFDYADRTEYEAGRCCTEYWMGRVRTLGARFTIPDQSSLLDLHWANQGGRIGFGWPLYGYFTNQPRISEDGNGRMIVDGDGTFGDQDEPPNNDRSRNSAG